MFDEVEGIVRFEASQVYLPPGWPSQVLPPGCDDWEKSALAFLLDTCPPTYRLIPVVARHPRVAAQFASVYVRQRVSSAETGAASIRASLHEILSPEALEQAVAAWHREAAQLQRELRAIDLVTQALDGVDFVAKL